MTCILSGPASGWTDIAGGLRSSGRESSSIDSSRSQLHCQTLSNLLDSPRYTGPVYIGYNEVNDRTLHYLPCALKVLLR